MSELKNEIEAMLTAAKKAGKEVIRIYNTDFSHSKKENKTLVTEADLASEKIILEELSHFDYGIISEELEDNLERFEKKRIWVIDPLDGTLGFINKTYDFSIMIGLIEDNKPILACVYAPLLGKMYYAEKGKGTFLSENGGKFIKINIDEIRNETIALIGRNHKNENERSIYSKLEISKNIEMGSIGIKLGYIAEGKADIYINTTSHLGEWDACAPSLILEEAGGFVYDLLGDSLIYNTKERKMKTGIVASSKNNKKVVLNVIKTHLKR